MTPIPLITGSYHLGDSAGLFQDAAYIGHELRLPFRRTWMDSQAERFLFSFHTSDVETWGDWQGHRITINGTEIGRLRDPDDRIGAFERFEIVVERAVLEHALGSNDNFLVVVALDKQPPHPGLSDDFVLRRIETDGSFAATIGWK